MAPKWAARGVPGGSIGTLGVPLEGPIYGFGGARKMGIAILIFWWPFGNSSGTFLGILGTHFMRFWVPFSQLLVISAGKGPIGEQLSPFYWGPTAIMANTSALKLAMARTPTGLIVQWSAI